MSGRKLKEEKQVEELTPENVVTQMKSFLKSPDSFGSPKWYLPTGNYALDYILSGKIDGTGGWPGGRISEVFGDPSTGKTLLIAKAGSIIQQMGGIFIIADVEDRWDRDFCEVQGLDFEKVIPMNRDTIDTVEGFATTTKKLLDKFGDPLKNKIVIGLDSSAALSHTKERNDFEKDGEIKSDQGIRAKKLRAMLRLLAQDIYQAGAILLASNHVTQNPNITYGSNRITPGGSAPIFYASIRLELKIAEEIKIKDKLRPIGVTLSAYAAKNSLEPPHGKCSIDIYWGSGVDPYSGLVDMMLDLDIISQSGGWYKYKDKSFHKTDILDIIKEFPDILTHDNWENPYFKVRS